MAIEAQNYLQMPLPEFKEMLLNAVDSMGYSVSSIHVEDENRIQVTARDESAAIDNDILFLVKRSKRKVGVRDVKKFLKHMDDLNKPKGVFISPAGFTDKALELADGGRLRLLSAAELADLGGPTTPTPQRIIYEDVFEPALTLHEAGQYFEAKRGKPLLGFIGLEESVKDVVGRYTPMGCFELVRARAVGAGAAGRVVNVTEGRSVFYVNLNTCLLYYVHKGVFGKPPSLKSTNLLRTVLELPAESVSLLAEVMDAEHLSLSSLLAAHGLMAGSRIDSLVLLNNTGLITYTPDGGTIMSNLSLPRFGDSRYDLGYFLHSRKSVDSEFEADSIEFRPTDVLKILQNLFMASGVFKGVVYLPYYTCVYVNELREIRYDLLVKPKFKSSG
jgi:hypothetical protein